MISVSVAPESTMPYAEVEFCGTGIIVLVFKLALLGTISPVLTLHLEALNAAKALIMSLHSDVLWVVNGFPHPVPALTDS